MESLAGTAAQPDIRPHLPTVPSDWEHDVRGRLAAGEDRALNEVYEQYSSFVYGVALRVIGDPRAAEDITQDVFLFIWERPEAFDPARGSLRTWLGTLAHRRAVDYVRREEARRRRAQRESGSAPRSTCYPTSNGERSSSPTSMVAPTGRWPNSSASPKAPRSPGSASGCGASRPPSKPTGRSS